jgi:SAM-dependent methyltransferase
VPSAQGRASAIKEAIRVLKPGGKLLIVDISKVSEYRKELVELGLTPTDVKADVAAGTPGERPDFDGGALALLSVAEDVERDRQRDRDRGDTTEEHDRLELRNVERVRKQRNATEEDHEGDDEVEDVHGVLTAGRTFCSILHENPSSRITTRVRRADGANPRDGLTFSPRRQYLSTCLSKRIRSTSCSPLSRTRAAEA